MNNKKELFEEIKKIIVSNDKIKEDEINLYDLSKVIRKKEIEFRNEKKIFENYLLKQIKKNFDKNSDLIIYDFNYEKKELKIGFKFSKDFKKIIFGQKNNQLFIKESESNYADDLLFYMGEDFLNFYNFFINYDYYHEQVNFNVKPINSKFLVDISNYGVNIYVKRNNDILTKIFELNSRSWNNTYICKCNSDEIKNLISNNEDEIFKKIFVKINECPEWSKSELYKLKKEQKEEIKNTGEKCKEENKRKFKIKKMFKN